jgi:acyl-CoA thioesterase-1
VRKGGLYVSIGDSTTWDIPSQAGAKGSDLYTFRIWDAINKSYSPIRYINKGLGGNTSSETAQNLRWVSILNPDLVTIGLGMNDAAGATVSTTTYKANLNLIIDTLRLRNPNVVIILCTPNRSSDATRSTLADYRTAMAEVATSKNVGIVRFEDGWTDAQIAANTTDGIHPNSTAHGLLFNLAWTVVQSQASTWLNGLGK